MSAVKSKYWELQQEGKLCDLTLVEETPSGETEDYPVHRLIMYTECEYFQRFFDSSMDDATTDRIVVKTEATELGLLGLVIRAIYAPYSRAERIYYTFAGEHSLDETMAVYLLCSYLALETHLRYLEKGIRDHFPIGELAMWWRKRGDSGLVVPPDIEEFVQEYLRKSIKYIGSAREAFISIDALIALWPETDDVISKQVGEFLTGLRDSAVELNETDNPNEWAFESDDEDEDNAIPESLTHPKLVPHPKGTEENGVSEWIDPDTGYVFQEHHRKYYVVARLRGPRNVRLRLTNSDRQIVKENCWKLLPENIAIMNDLYGISRTGSGANARDGTYTSVLLALTSAPKINTREELLAFMDTVRVPGCRERFKVEITEYISSSFFPQDTPGENE